MSWLERIGQLELLTTIYEEIYSPPGVMRQLKDHYATKAFVETRIKPIILTSKDNGRLCRLSKRWQKKLELDDVVDAEVFVAYKFFIGADEMVYANKDAEHKFRPYGAVRDIADLYILAERIGIFQRRHSIDFLTNFTIAQPPYRPAYIKELLKNIAL